MGLQSNLQKTLKFSFLRAMLRSDSWSEISRSKEIFLFQMDFGCQLEVKHMLRFFFDVTLTREDEGEIFFR